MTTAQRREAILDYLDIYRHVKTDVLSKKFGVSKRMILKDISKLSTSYPIYTVAGWGGGVFAMDSFRRNKPNLSSEQLSLLNRLLDTLSGNDKIVMLSIIKSNEGGEAK